MDPRGCAGAGLHGAYLPDEIRWEQVPGSGNHHHLVYLMRLRAGHVRRSRIFIGEVRRSSMKGTGARKWRAFPVVGGTMEFPEVLETHIMALEYLKARWETRMLVPEKDSGPKRRAASKRQETPKPLSQPSMSWAEFFGGDPFA